MGLTMRGLMDHMLKANRMYMEQGFPRPLQASNTAETKTITVRRNATHSDRVFVLLPQTHCSPSLCRRPTCQVADHLRPPRRTALRDPQPSHLLPVEWNQDWQEGKTFPKLRNGLEHTDNSETTLYYQKHSEESCSRQQTNGIKFKWLFNIRFPEALAISYFYLTPLSRTMNVLFATAVPPWMAQFTSISDLQCIPLYSISLHILIYK